MRMVLLKHSRVAIADENHFLGHPWPWLDRSWSPERVGSLDTDDDVRRLVDRIYSDGFQRGTWFRGQSGLWRWTARKMPPRRPRAAPPGRRAIAARRVPAS